jgi:hypothetical protein
MLKSRWEIPWQLGRKVMIHAYHCCSDSRVPAGHGNSAASLPARYGELFGSPASWRVGLWLVTRTILQIPQSESFFRNLPTYLARPCATKATSCGPDTYQSNLPMVTCRCRVPICAWEAGPIRQGSTIAHRVWKFMPSWQHDE